MRAPPLAFHPRFYAASTTKDTKEHEWIAENGKNRRKYAQKSADKADKLPAIAVKRFEFYRL